MKRKIAAKEKKYEHGGKVEDKTGPESEPVDATLHENEYVLAESSVQALGVDWLDNINKAFEEDSEANPLWVLINAMNQLPNTEESKIKPAMSGKSESSNHELSPAALEALGSKFLETLETFIRLNPSADPRKALNGSAEYLDNKSKDLMKYKRGGKVLNDNPIRI